MAECRLTVESVVCDLSLGAAEGFERCENEYAATVAERGGLLRLSYEETSEGGKIKSEITVADTRVRVRRTGAIESDFVFAEGESTTSLYRIPPYSFDARICTKKIRNNLTRGGGKLTIIYDMNVGGADKNVRMTITLAEVENDA